MTFFDAASDVGPRIFEFDGYRVDIDRLEVRRGRELLPLPAKAVAVLALLIKNRGSTLSRAEILDAVWPDTTVEEASVDSRVAILRKVMGKSIVRTMSGRGYVFTHAGDVEPAETVQKAPVRTNVPVARPELYGRESVLAKIQGLLKRHSLITLVGLPGAGKTAIAVKIGQAQLAECDEVWNAEVRALGEVEPIARAICTSVGIMVPHGFDALDRLASHFGHKRVLLILDIQECDRDAISATIDHLFRHCPALTIITTAHLPLRRADEQVVRIGPLSLKGTHGTIQSALRVPAIAQFVDRMTRSWTTFELDDWSAPKIARMCRALDGFPGAIDFVAHRAAHIDLEVCERLIDEFIKLEKHPMRIGFEALRPTLSDRLRRVIALLSAFDASFDLDAAYALAGHGMTKIELFDCLSELVERSILTTGRKSTKTYRMFNVVRWYVRSLTSDDEWHERQATASQLGRQVIGGEIQG